MTLPQRNDSQLGARECPFCAKLMHLTYDGCCDNCGRNPHETMVAVAKEWRDGGTPSLDPEFPA